MARLAIIPILVVVVLASASISAQPQVKSAVGETAVALADGTATSVGEPAFDLPRVAKKNPRKVAIQRLCNDTCACYRQCDVWSDSCGEAPASNCKEFGTVPPCTCSDCVCF